MKLTIHRHDQGFCPIYHSQKGNQVVNARELHQILGIKTKFATWIQREIELHGFLENGDFCKISPTQNWEVGNFKKNAGSRGMKIEYIFRLESAKHIAMATMTDQGKHVRNYFIWCEQVKDRAVSYAQSQGMEHEENLQALLSECTVPELQREQSKRVASKIYAGRVKNTTLIIEHHRRVCLCLTGKRPALYKREIAQKFHKHFGSARDAMRRAEPHLAATACFIDRQVAEGVPMDRIERSPLIKVLPDVFREMKRLKAGL
jgi:phage anti-repressor protein